MSTKKHQEKHGFEERLPEGSYPRYLTSISNKELSMVAHAKRFKERYTADPAFRELVATDSREAAKKYNIKIDPEDIRPIWDPDTRRKHNDQILPMSDLLKLCVEYSTERKKWENRHRSGETIADPNFRFWRQRQIARNNSDIGEQLNSSVVHAPVCFELTSGCTVGCWFCAISADRFTGAFAYTPENKLLWKEVLEVVRDIVGPSAEAGFCYWATDPFDNPDYEKLITDYHAIIGALPSTNTAIAHKHLPRTRALLRMWENYGFTYNRFSILTVKILDKIHEEFTPEELIWVGLNMVNKGSVAKKATAGRALEKIKKLSDRGEDYNEIGEELTQGTIACVSGFLFNMVEKTVKLISPCKANDRWPDGYKVFDEGVFTNGADLRSLLERMISDNMPTSIRDDQILKFRPDLHCKLLPNGVTLTTDNCTQHIENPYYGRELGELLREGTHTANDIVVRISRQGATPQEIRRSIEILFENGLLDDEKN